MDNVNTVNNLPVSHYAGFWIRLVADILDSIILSVVSWILEYALLGLLYVIWAAIQRHQGQAPLPFSDAFNAFWLQIFNVGIYAVLAFPYYVWGHFRYGTTLGKRPFKIYVVTKPTGIDEPKAITIRQSIIRCVAYIPSYLLFLTGFLMAAFHPEKRALHDLLAGTISIRRTTR